MSLNLWRLARFALVAIGLLVAAWGTAYFTVFREVAAVVRSQASFAGVAPSLVPLLGWLIAASTAGLILKHARDAFLGRTTGLRLLSVAGSAVALVLGVQLMQRDWLFDIGADGRAVPRYRLCRPVVATDLPRLIAIDLPFDPITGRVCPVLDQTVAPAFLMLRRGQPPEPVLLSTVAQLDAYAIYSVSGGTRLFEGAPRPDDGAVRLFSAAGFDPNADDLLRPVTPPRLAEIRAQLLSAERAAQAAAAAAAANAERNAAAAERKRVAEDARRDRDAQRAAVAALRRAMRALELQQPNATVPVLVTTTPVTTASPAAAAPTPPGARWSTSPPQPVELSGDATWTTFFREKDAPPNTIYFFARAPSLSPIWLSRVVADVSAGRTLTPSTRIAKAAFYDGLDLAQLIDGNFESLKRIAVPTGIPTILIIDRVQPYSAEPAAVTVRWIEIDTIAKQARVHARLVAR